METIDLPLSESPGTLSSNRAIADFSPVTRDFVEIATFSILLRAALFLIIFSRLHYSFEQWPTHVRDDGSSYIAYARALLGDASQMTLYDQRVFPGYPAIIALVHKAGVPFNAAAVAVDWTSAGLVAALSAALFRDRRVGWALGCLPLQYFINSTLMMSETPMLALAMAGLLLANRGRNAPGAFFLGLAGLVRPMACFAVIGEIFRDLFQSSRTVADRIRSALWTSVVSGGVVTIGIAALHHWTGDAFRGAKVYANGPNTYNGHLLQWPFQSLIHESLRPEVPRARVLYIWIHVAITLAALALLCVRCIRAGRNADGRDLLAAPWLGGDTLFVLCIGSYWGFEHFPRFTIPALPALFWGIRDFLPRRRSTWFAIAAVILVSASFVVLHDFIVPD